MIHKLLNIKYPIIQGAMAHIADAPFAAHVSNSGGLGIIATGSMTPDQAREAIRECKKLTDKPFGVNVMLMNPHSEDIIEVICEEEVPVITTGAGSPGKYISKLKEKNIIIMPVVASVALAKRMERMGVDAVIVEGSEAGGHIGETTTMALLPQVKDAISIPVVCAGGVADSRGMVAALMLGASGVQIGTCLLTTHECKIHENYKQVVLKAKDRDTVVTGRSAGVPVRIYRNKMSREYTKLEQDKADKETLERLTLGSLYRAVYEGDVDNGSLMMGQIAGLCKTSKSIQETLDDLIQGVLDLNVRYTEVVKELSDL